MLNKKEKELVKKFQCEENREYEEGFAQTLSENEKARLFFINENQAFTDGSNIVVDPAFLEIFADKEAIAGATAFLELPAVMTVDAWSVLHLITRGQTIHECLHILYTDFTPFWEMDSKYDTENKKKTVSFLSNMIEDFYIEAVGCSVYDNLEMFLSFLRVCIVLAKKKEAGTAERLFSFEESEETIENVENPGDETSRKCKLLVYLNYMVTWLLYPMVELKEPETSIAGYVDKTKDLFLEGSMASSPEERKEFSSRIFDEIVELIPPDENPLDFGDLPDFLPGFQTHSNKKSSVKSSTRRGKKQEVFHGLFRDESGGIRIPRIVPQEAVKILRQFAIQKQKAEKIAEEKDESILIFGKEYDGNVLHKEIKIIEKHPKVNYNLRKAYQNIYNQYRINIKSYQSKFLQILRAKTTVRQDKFRFGAGISSKHFSDLKKRYWYRNIQAVDVPDLAVLLLVDGSGSMSGERLQAVMQSSVILHEVLRKQGIPHAIVEHRSRGELPEMEANVLVDFDSREEEKYNILQMHAGGDNRDGLALYWAERYLAKKVGNEYKLIIVLSDGSPCHYFDHYYPPVSTKDTANIVRKISQRGTSVIGISLDVEDSWDCYEQLKEIYPNLIGCNDLKRLTKQILELLVRLMR